MPADRDRDTEILRRLRELGAGFDGEVGAASRQLSELQLLLRQTVSELDRLTPRSSQAAQRVRDMEAHIESYSRADIKDIYAAAQETQMRVFMMQLQQEQIEHKQRAIGAYHDALAAVVALANEVELTEEDRKPSVTDAIQSNVSQQESLARVIQAQEDERRHLSRQIHDGPAQALANLVLRAEICERLMSDDPTAAKRELAGLKKLVVASLQEARHFIFDLRPMILDDLGLAPTLRRYCELLSETGSVPVRLSVAGNERRVSSAAEIGIFRVVQEAIRNGLRHGEPALVQVLVEFEQQSVSVAVQDDGRGCDGVAVLAAARQGQTTGLATMEEHMRTLNGTLLLQSEPGRGCKVRIAVPLEQRAT